MPSRIIPQLVYANITHISSNLVVGTLAMVTRHIELWVLNRGVCLGKTFTRYMLIWPLLWPKSQKR